MYDEHDRAQWAQPPSGAATAPPPGEQFYGHAPQQRCEVCASLIPPGARFCRVCGTPAMPGGPPPATHGRGRRAALYVGLGVVLLAAIGVALWLLLDNGGGGKTQAGHPAPPPPHKQGGAGGHRPSGSDVARISQVTKEYGRTLSPKRSCQLETVRKQNDDFGSPAACVLNIKPNPVTYHIQKVTVHGPHAVVKVTGRLGVETLWLVKTRQGRWLIDGVWHGAPAPPGTHPHVA